MNYAAGWVGVGMLLAKPAPFASQHSLPACSPASHSSRPPHDCPCTSSSQPVCAGFIFVSCIQKWRPDRRELAEFYDVNIVVRNRLALPVTGILGSSYENAVKAQPVAAAAAAAAGGALARLPAPLEAKSTSDDELPPPARG